MSQAILLVGGQGTRLRPLTTHTPKPMVQAAGVPLLAHQLARAVDAGVTRLVLATSYLPEVFEQYFGDGSAYGVELLYAPEREPLGTGGAIRNAAALLSCAPQDPVLVFNGDILSGVDLTALVEAHQRRAAAVTLHLTRVADPRAFGLVPTGVDGRVLSFLEKPQTPEEIVTDQINAGCYVFTRSVIDTIPGGRPVSVERETFPDLLRAGAPVYGSVDETYWLDLGTPAALVRGSADLVRGLFTSSAMPGPPGESLVLPGACVAATATLSGGTTVSQGAVVADGAVVDGSIVLPGAYVGPDAVVHDSVVGAAAFIGARTRLEGATVGDHAQVGSDNELLIGSRIACGAILPDAAVRFSAGVMACLPHEVTA